MGGWVVEWVCGWWVGGQVGVRGMWASGFVVPLVNCVAAAGRGAADRLRMRSSRKATTDTGRLAHPLRFRHASFAA